jgi:hypothetical protein
MANRRPGTVAICCIATTEDDPGTGDYVADAAVKMEVPGFGSSSERVGHRL